MLWDVEGASGFSERVRRRERKKEIERGGRKGRDIGETEKRESENRFLDGQRTRMGDKMGGRNAHFLNRERKR